MSTITKPDVHVEFAKKLGRHHEASNAFTTIAQQVDVEMRAGQVPAPSFSKYEVAQARLWRSLQDVVRAARASGQHAEVWDSSGKLFIHGFEEGITVEGHMWSAILTDDGGPLIQGWHKSDDGDGPEEAQSVRYEVLVFSSDTNRLVQRRHGFADATSRKIVQTG